MRINITTPTQANFHLQRGEYIFFDLENGFGFFKQLLETDRDYGYHKKALDQDGIILIFQHDNEPGIEMTTEEASHLETIKQFINKGFKLYVTPGEKLVVIGEN